MRADRPRGALGIVNFRDVIRSIAPTQRVLIRIEMGKGRKDRHAMLSPQFSFSG
jgi:hypothetical protein